MTDTKRSLGAVAAVFLVVGNVLGVGVFYTAGSVQQLAGGSTGALGAWALGGLLAIFGGLVSAECATRFPQNGGDYLYLSEGMGRPIGFLSGWSSFVVGFPGSIATLAAALAMLSDDLEPLPVVWGVTLLALLPIRIGALVNGLVTSLALCLLIAVVFRAPEAAVISSQEWSLVGFGAALVPVYFSYSGWNVITYVSGECLDPRRTLPIALISGILAVTAVYMLFSQAIPPAVEPARLGTGIAPILETMTATLGKAGAIGVPAIMVAGVCTTLMSTALAGPRLTCEMAGRADFFPWLAARTKGSGVPVRATLIQGVMASGLVMTGTFEDLLEWTTGVMLLFGACLGIAHLRLRVGAKRATEADEVFLDPLFPLSSIALVLLCIGILISAVLQGEAWHMLAGLGVVLCGLPIHYYVRRRQQESGILASGSD